MHRTPTHPLRQGRFLLVALGVLAFGVVLLATEGDRRASHAAAASSASFSAVVADAAARSAHSSSGGARRLLGGDAAPAASPPPPPLTAREALRQSLANYVLERFAASAPPSGLAALSTWWTTAQSAIRDARGDGDGDGDGDGVALGGLDAPPFVLESKRAAFTAKLLDAATALEPSFDATRDVIPTSAQARCCAVVLSSTRRSSSIPCRIPHVVTPLD
jgi:hypothetical protein